MFFLENAVLSPDPFLQRVKKYFSLPSPTPAVLPTTQLLAPLSVTEALKTLYVYTDLSPFCLWLLLLFNKHRVQS